MLHALTRIWPAICLAVVLCGCDNSRAGKTGGASQAAGPPVDSSPAATSPLTSPPADSLPVASTIGKPARPPANVHSDDSQRTTAQESPADNWFEDATARTSIEFTYHNGREAGRFYLLEAFGGGVALVDFDLDGDVDLLAAGGGTIASESGQVGGLPSALFRNERGWRFDNVSALAEIDQPIGYSFACAITDFNSDGFPDLLITSYSGTRLYANRGDGTFRQVADWARPAAEGLATAAAFGDVDRDGHPDLLLAFYADWDPQRDLECHWTRGERDLCGPTSYPGTFCRFYHNSGDGGFDDWSVPAGIRGNTRGLGVVAADLNGDGWIDFFVSSDESPNHLYLGGPQLPLLECAHTAGVALGDLGSPVANMGVAIGDYNGDGRPDIFVTTYEKEDSLLLKNLGDGLFVNTMMHAGLAGISRKHVKFGTSLTDFDGDGWLDLFVLNGHTQYTTGESPFKQTPELFRNMQGRRFVKVSRQGGKFFGEEHSGRGNSVGDLDDDGAPDLVTSPVNEPLQIQRNRLTPKNYVSVELRARQGERDATGAQVTATFDGRQLVRWVVRGEGYFSQFDPRLIFPVKGPAEKAEVVVAWPGSGRETFRNLPVRRSHVLVEGRGEAAGE